MRKRIQSFSHAIRGIKASAISEIHMKVHIAISVAVLIAGFALDISILEWFVCLLCIGLVLSLEVVNTAIEDIVDLVSPDHHPLAGKAKDAAAGAVLIAAIVSAIAGSIIFIPKILALIQP